MALTFDATYYLQHRPDVFQTFVATAGSTGLTWVQFAEQHYNTFGRFEGANPNTTFNTNEYLSANPDVAAAGVNPFQHYLANGVNEGRAPSASFPSFASFDEAAYLGANPDLGAAGITTKLQAYAHFVVFGQFESRPGAPVIDTGLPGQTYTLTAALGENIVGTSGNDTINAVVDAAGVAGGQTLSLTDSVDGAGGRDTINILASGGGAATLSGTISNVEVINLVADVVGADTIATAIDFGNFSGAERINVNGDVVTEVSGLTADNSVNFVAAAGGVEANVADDAAVANIVLTSIAMGQTLAVGEVTANDLSTVNVSGSVAGAGALTIDLDVATTSGLAAADEDTLNLALTSDSAVAILSSSLVTIDASASTGDLTLDLETDALSTVTSVLGGSGDDAITTEGTVGTANVVVTAGAGVDTITITAPTGAGSVTIVTNAGDSGLTAATIDNIVGFATTNDKLDFNLAAGSATNFLNGGTSSSFVDAFTNAKTAFELDAGTLQYFLSDDGANSYLFIDRDLNGTVDQAVEITGIAGGAVVAADIIA